jgi:hypothetical protein
MIHQLDIDILVNRDEKVDQKLVNSIESATEKSDYLKHFWNEAGYDYNPHGSFATEIDDDTGDLKVDDEECSKGNSVTPGQ